MISVRISSAIYVKIVSGTIAVSPRYFSQATRATLMTPAKANEMMTGLSFHAFVFPPIAMQAPDTLPHSRLMLFTLEVCSDLPAKDYYVV